MQLEVPDQESLSEDVVGWADNKPYRPLALQLAAKRPQPPQLLFRRFGIQDMGRPTSVHECGASLVLCKWNCYEQPARCAGFSCKEAADFMRTLLMCVHWTCMQRGTSCS
jgi:hypothetical protein